MLRLLIALFIGFMCSTLLAWLGGADTIERGVEAVGWLLLVIVITCIAWLLMWARDFPR